MATQQEIDREVELIREKWANPAARNGLFGNILKSVNVSAIRGITAQVEFTWPITAIAGTNGSGKTTLLQLCSAAYLKEGGGRNYKIGEWVRGAFGDETPAFSDDSVVSFSFWNDEPTISIPYQRERTRWGYPRRGNPTRNVVFIGITLFAPRIERRDRLHVFRSRLQVKSSAPFTNELVRSISGVLGTAYTGGNMHTVGLEVGVWTDSLPQITRGACSYGEPHMGAGEQKIIRLIRSLEALPSKSLVLLEEPEITLHPDAQRGLAWYLMSLCRRKGHQIVITTHSGELFETLPREARTLLVRRGGGGIDVIPSPPRIVAARELSGIAASNKDLLLVEDDVAKSLLEEILRRHDRVLFNNSSVVAVGNTHDVYSLTRSFRAEGVRAIGIRDPDIGDQPAVGIFSLPGDQRPEALLLDPVNIGAANGLINGLHAAFERAQVHGIGRNGAARDKAVFTATANEMGITKAQLSDRLTMAWLQNNEAQVQQLLEAMRVALEGEA